MTETCSRRPCSTTCSMPITFDRQTLPALQKIFYSAAPMPEQLLRRDLRGRADLRAGLRHDRIGRPRLCLHAHQHVLDGPPQVVRRLRSAGQPMVGCDVRIARPDGTECAPGEPGEIVIRSPDGLMHGYWNNHPATQDTLRDGFCTPATSARPTTRASSSWSTGSRT